MQPKTSDKIEKTLDTRGSNEPLEKTIFGTPISEVRRQCEAYHVESPFDQPLSMSQEPMDVVITGGEKIIDNPKTMKLVGEIYRQGGRQH